MQATLLHKQDGRLPLAGPPPDALTARLSNTESSRINSASNPEGVATTGEQARLASVLLSFSQEEGPPPLPSSSLSRKQQPPPRTLAEQRPLAPLPAASPRGEEENNSAASLTRLSPAPAPVPVRAYAKLQGRTWEYYVQELAITLGRCPDPGSASTGGGVDVFLGASEGISRKHLRIEYCASERCWELYCFGRSGVTVAGKHYEPFCQPVQLASRSLIQVAEVAFYFLLPIDSVASPPPPPPSLSSSSNGKAAIHPPLHHFRLQNPPRNECSCHGAPRRRGKGRRKRTEMTATADDALAQANAPKKDNSGESADGVELPIASNDPPPPPDVGDLIKPPLSYACLIAEAINSTEEKRLTLSGIYQYLTEKYPYFRYTMSGWQNSIRHNLSLNKAFRKMPRTMGEPGKGMFWVVDGAYKHLVEGTGPGRRMHRSKSMQPPGSSPPTPQNSSAPTSPQIARQNSLLVGLGNYVPILPTRPVSAAPALSQAFLSPQLLEAAAVVEMVPKLAMKPSPEAEGK